MLPHSEDKASPQAAQRYGRGGRLSFIFFPAEKIVCFFLGGFAFGFPYTQGKDCNGQVAESADGVIDLSKALGSRWGPCPILVIRYPSFLGWRATAWTWVPPPFNKGGGDILTYYM